MPKKKIAIIQYKWQLQSFTYNLLKYLVSKGENVQLFIDQDSINKGYVSKENIDLFKENFQVFGRKTEKNKNILFKILQKIFYELKAITKNKFSFIDDFYLKKIDSVFNKNFKDYKYIIGIEKQGLILAYFLSRKGEIPIFYYSLELYLENFTSFPSFNLLRKQEKIAHSKCIGLIIQDQIRANILNKANDIKNVDSIIMPVSVSDKKPIYKNKIGYWHSKYPIPKGNKIILYFGFIKREDRGLENTIKGLKNVKGISVIIHGNGDRNFISELKRKTKNSNIFISNELVDEDKIDELIISSDIGLNWYTNKDFNNLNTAFSSEKLALFLNFGKPIISNKNKSFSRLFNEFKCGVQVCNMKSSFSAIREINNSYEKYSRNALLAYEKYYDLQKNLINLYDRLNFLYEDKRKSR